MTDDGPDIGTFATAHNRTVWVYVNDMRVDDDMTHGSVVCIDVDIAHRMRLTIAAINTPRRRYR